MLDVRVKSNLCQTLPKQMFHHKILQGKKKKITVYPLFKCQASEDKKENEGWQWG